jgi:adenylate kinase
VILLMGLPGSGKGTQGKMLADQVGLHLISMGELVRLYVTGERRKEMLRGKLLSDDEVINILDKVLNSLPDDDDTILDGFPRTTKQAEWLLEQATNGRFVIEYVIHLVASYEAVKARLKGRGRADDHDEVITARFAEYEQLTEPLLEWYRQHDIEVVDVNAERTVDAVNDDLVKRYAAGK